LVIASLPPEWFPFRKIPCFVIDVSELDILNFERHGYAIDPPTGGLISIAHWSVVAGWKSNPHFC
jgi:hypothetical protein